MFHSRQKVFVRWSAPTKPTKFDLWYICLRPEIVLLHSYEKCTMKETQTPNPKLQGRKLVQITPLTRRTARHFTNPFIQSSAQGHPLRWYCTAKNGTYIHGWNTGATNDPKSFVISHEPSTKIAHERVGGFVSSSPSPLFLITPTSDKETTLKEFISVFQIKTQTAIVQTVTEWILQRRHPRGTAWRPQNR